MRHIESMEGESRAHHHRDQVAVVVVVRSICVDSDTEPVPLLLWNISAQAVWLGSMQTKPPSSWSQAWWIATGRFHFILRSRACSDARARPLYDEAFLPTASWLVRFRSRYARTIRRGTFRLAAPRAGCLVQS